MLNATTAILLFWQFFWVFSRPCFSKNRVIGLICRLSVCLSFCLKCKIWGCKLPFKKLRAKLKFRAPIIFLSKICGVCRKTSCRASFFQRHCLKATYLGRKRLRSWVQQDAAAEVFCPLVCSGSCNGSTRPRRNAIQLRTIWHRRNSATLQVHVTKKRTRQTRSNHSRLYQHSHHNNNHHHRRHCIFTRKSSYWFQCVLAIAILSARLSVCLYVCHTGGSVKSGAS